MWTTPRRRFLRLLVSTFAIYAAVGGIGATPAKAHASLIGSVPAYGATLAEAPETIELLFDNLVEPGLVKVRLKDGNDVEVGKGTLVGERTPRNEVEFTLPAHGEGSFLITWVSFAFDGHIVSGTIPYTVDPSGAPVESGTTNPNTPAENGTTGEGDTLTLSTSGTTNRIIDIAEIQARFLSYIGFAALFGALLWRWALGRARQETAPETTPEATEAPDAKTKLSEIVNGAYTLGLWLTVGMLGARAGVSAWRFIDAGYSGSETIGQIWSGQVGGYLAAAIILAAVAIRSKHNAVIFAGSTVAAALSAGLGHSASEPAPGLNTVMIAIHLVAASIWVGGVGVLGYAATDGAFQKIADRWSQLREAVANASSAFIAAAAALAITGIRTAYVYSDGIPSGRWGLTLAAKLALAGGAGLIGLYHYQRSKRGKGAANATLIVEAGLLVLTLTAAAVLSVTTIG